jgi:hypothetical protein
MTKALRQLKPVIAATLALAGVAVYAGMPAVPVAQYLLSSIGAGATVPPNEYNTAAEQLKRKEAELDARERALTERESAPAQPQGSERVLGVLLAATGAALGIEHYRKRGATPRVA